MGSLVSADTHTGGGETAGHPRRPDGTIVFPDWPDFRPNLSPREMFEQGAFGGTYWRPIHSAVTGRDYKNVHRRYAFLNGLPEELLSDPTCDVSKNKYGVHSGSSLEAWEEKGWIVAQDPYGWVMWYCEFYAGRRSPDDARQIKRWLNFAGPNGRFLRRLASLVRDRSVDDARISPVIRQGLHHWAKTLTVHDL
jgi:hypothetical protein